MRLLCPAKINLHLRVGRRRADGFHPLLTWMTTVGLFDTLTMETLPPPAGEGDVPAGGDANRAARQASQGSAQHSSSPSRRERAGAAGILSLHSNQPGLPVDETNLVVRAAEMLASAFRGNGSGNAIHAAATGSSAALLNAGSGRQFSPALVTGSAPRNKRENTERRSHALSRGASSSERDESALVPRDAGEGVAVSGQRGNDPSQIEGEIDRVGPVGAKLEKMIPLGAGLGGGSSDAARTLVALNRLWQLGWSADQLAEVAARLGSDIPFFLYGPSSICTGRGEVVRPVPAPAKAKWVTLILPDIHMPTAAVYRRFDELNLGFDEQMALEPDWTTWASDSAKDLLPRLVNDLEPPAFEIRKDLAALRADIETQLFRPVRMSGSGSSLFTLYDDRLEAESAAHIVSDRFGVRTHAIELAPKEA